MTDKKHPPMVDLIEAAEMLLHNSTGGMVVGGHYYISASDMRRLRDALGAARAELGIPPSGRKP